MSLQTTLKFPSYLNPMLSMLLGFDRFLLHALPALTRKIDYYYFHGELSPTTEQHC